MFIRLKAHALNHLYSVPDHGRPFTIQPSWRDGYKSRLCQPGSMKHQASNRFEHLHAIIVTDAQKVRVVKPEPCVGKSVKYISICSASH